MKQKLDSKWDGVYSNYRLTARDHNYDQGMREKEFAVVVFRIREYNILLLIGTYGNRTQDIKEYVVDQMCFTMDRLNMWL